MENLVLLGAFDRVARGRPRRELLWELAAIEESLPSRPGAHALVDLPGPSPVLPPMGERTRIATEYALCDVATGPHLVSFLRARLDALGCVPLAQVADHPDGGVLRVAGAVIARQAPASAKGFRFFTLADEGGHLDLVFKPKVARQTRVVANLNPLLMVEGRLQSDSGRLNLIVDTVVALDGQGRIHRGTEPALDPTLPVPTSHDFH
jgi:DNA polymerase III alpha subunit